MAATTYSFFDAALVTEIERERAIKLEETSALARVLPLVDENTDAVLWDKRDNVRGLLPVGGRNDDFPVLNAEGVERLAMAPGHFHGTKKLDADRIARGARPGALGDVIDVNMEIGELQRELQVMGLSVRDACRGKLLTLGQAAVPDKDGKMRTTAIWGDYNSRYAALAGGDKWDAPTTAKPYKNIREWFSYYEGSGHFYNSQAIILMSRITANKMVLCDEVRNYRDKYGATIQSVNALNELIDREGDMPLIVPVEDGYLDESGNFQPYIANGYAVIVGYNPMYGIKAGDFVLTRNSDKLGQVGIYAETDFNPNPPKLPRTHHSFSGGPRINYHKQIQVIKVY
ncbi:MAG: hypothetical protein E6R03_00195 [Hyphomicrobiaceae bacterium]|nr:MAG: hypothetical protein E6R03_00195 [Hyphomicrobiaceae bacterium]